MQVPSITSTGWYSQTPKSASYEFIGTTGQNFVQNLETAAPLRIKFFKTRNAKGSPDEIFRYLERKISYKNRVPFLSIKLFDNANFPKHKKGARHEFFL